MKGFALIACLMLAWVAAQAEEHCSLVVKVVDIQGNEISANIDVEQQGGRRHIRRFTRSSPTPGGERFCDLGILPVKVEMWIMCSRVIYPYVPLRWGETTTVVMMAEKLYCEDWVRPFDTCEYFFGFRDSTNKPVQDITVLMKEPRVATYKADAFGRVLVRIGTSSEFNASASAPGYQPMELNRSCDKQTTAEEYITMKSAER